MYPAGLILLVALSINPHSVRDLHMYVFQLIARYQTVLNIHLGLE